MLGYGHLKYALTQLSQLGRISLNLHAVGYQGGTGSGETTHAFYLYDTQAAAAIGFQLGMIAQSGDINSSLSSRFQHRLAGADLHLPAVYGSCYHSAFGVSCHY